MKKNKLFIIIGIAVIAVIALIVVMKGMKGKDKVVKTINPVRGEIKLVVTTTGDVTPQNRLQIVPPVAGRIDKILVKEGQRVTVGQTLVMMSSNDRAAIMDAANAQPDKNLKEWAEVYKPIPLIAPINVQVIVSQMQPGQTVGLSEAIVVLSDRLIVRAQVDETDIGKVHLGQKAEITLDAYQNTVVAATVDHIYYESQVVNNVTIYNVDILATKVPDYFRSGMSANVNIIQDDRSDVLTLPIDAVKVRDGKSFVFVQTADGKRERREVTIGIQDDKNIEIVSGIAETDNIIENSANYSLSKGQNAVNPFMPQRPRGMGGR
jgi:macrolide-specific efflux system membrane fusion protein